jgi:polyhydroxyalkanoate synthesis regulator phasin
MSKELKRLKDWLSGYEVALDNNAELEDIFEHINNFIDTLIREGEIAEHEAKKRSQDFKKHYDQCYRVDNGTAERVNVIMTADVTEDSLALINEDQR